MIFIKEKMKNTMWTLKVDAMDSAFSLEEQITIQLDVKQKTIKTQ